MRSYYKGSSQGLGKQLDSTVLAQEVKMYESDWLRKHQSWGWMT